jgi:Domain of unknown function (DUF4383)
MTAKTAALLIGIIFIAVGLLGFIDNPIVGNPDKAIFHTDTVHNVVHIVSGALFVLVALVAPGSCTTLLILFGLVYLLIGVIGLATIGTSNSSMGMEFGFLHINGADNFLHVALGIFIFLVGVATRRKVSVVP